MASDQSKPRFSPRWQLVAFLAAAAALNYSDRAAISSVFVALRADLGLSDVAIGMLGSVFLWSYALCSPIAGVIADRCSRSLVIAISLAAWSIVTALTGAATGLIMLIVLRVALGAAESLYLPSAIALIADHHQTPTRGLAMGIFSVGLDFGVVFGGAFAGYAAEHYGWRVGFWILGAAGIVIALASKSFLRDSPSVRITRSTRSEVGIALRYILQVPSYLILLAATMLGGVGIWIFLTWLPLYFFDAQHLTLASAGFAGTFILQASSVAGLVLGGWISDRVATRDTRARMFAQALFFLLCAPFLLLFMTRPGLGVVTFAIAAFAFFRGLGMSNQNPVMCDVIPACYRSTAVGLMNTCAAVAGGGGVLFAGLLKHTFGLNQIFAGVSGVYFVAGGTLIAGYLLFMRHDLQRASAYECLAA